MFYLRETKIDAGCWLVQIGQCRIVVSVWSDWTKIVGKIWLARIFSLIAFDDCSTVYGRFKLLDSFEGLLERPIIQDELEKKYVGLVQKALMFICMTTVLTG